MPSVAFSGNYINVMEGNSGRTQVNLTLFLSAASTNPVTVTYTTMLKTWGTATAGVDYIAKGQSEVTFLPGEVTKQISFEVLGDTLYEADEYFYVDLISASGATVVIEGAEGQRSPWQAVWIRNDDLATSLPNVIKGTLANETWRSTLENDQIDGGAGSDIVIWADTAKNYTLNFVSGQCIVKDTIGKEGVDTLVNIERLQFSDKTVLIESKSHASYAALPAKLYQFFITAFDAAPGVTYMDQLAEAYNYGLSVKEIVDIFTTKSQFTSVYASTLSNQDLATQLVNNIIKTSATETVKASAVADIKAALDIPSSTVNSGFRHFRPHPLYINQALT